MNYTKEQLNVARNILLNLISDDRQIAYECLGICRNMYLHNLNKKYSIKKFLYFFKIKEFSGNFFEREIGTIGLVSELSVGWENHSGDYSYPVPYNAGNKWEGKNLELRIDLMKYIVNKINIMLECMIDE